MFADHLSTGRVPNAGHDRSGYEVSFDRGADPVLKHAGYDVDLSTLV